MASFGHRFFERRPSLFNRAAVREDDSSLVRGDRGGLGDVPGVFSMRTAARLFLCRCLFAPIDACAAIVSAHGTFGAVFDVPTSQGGTFVAATLWN